MGLITLEGIRVFAYHGHLPEEKKLGGHFIVNVWVNVDTLVVQKSDNLNDTVDYVKIIDIVKERNEYQCKVTVYDPWVDRLEAKNEYGIKLLDDTKSELYDAIVIAVAHKEFKQMGIDTIRALCKPKHVVYDLKYLFPASQVDKRL